MSDTPRTDAAIHIANDGETVIDPDFARELECALQGCIEQFGYVRKGKLSAGGLGALEEAFRVLGLSDPHPAPAHLVCDEPNCGEASTCGQPLAGGYRRTCHKHMPR